MTDAHLRTVRSLTQRIRSNEHNTEAREEASEALAKHWKQHNKDQRRGK